MEKQRNYGIDLLRLVLMLMVCLLHVLGQGGVLSASIDRPVRYGLFWLLEVGAYCAVDAFAMISGYTASNRPQKWHRLAQMWTQAFFYAFVLTLLLDLLLPGVQIEPKKYIRYAMPVMGQSFWYFSGYFALFFAMPMLNNFLFSLTESGARKTLIILILLFSGMSLYNDAFQLENGSSALWLMVLYCVGALARRVRLFEATPTAALLGLYGAMCLLSWGVFQLFRSTVLITYVSPTIVLNAWILVTLFSRLRLKGDWIRRLSPLAFGVYLFQCNTVIWHRVLGRALAFCGQAPIGIALCWIFAATLALFTTGLLVEYLRSRMARALGIPALCERLTARLERRLDSMVK